MPHILLINEFYHPDICASAVVCTDHFSRMAKLRPDWQFTVITGNRAWDDPTRTHPPEESHNGVRILRVNRPPLKTRGILERAWGFAHFHRAARQIAFSLPRVDLVIGTTAPPLGAWLAASIAKQRKIPYIYKVFDLYPDLAITLERLRPGSLTKHLWRYGDIRTMRNASAVVTIADSITNRILETRTLGQTPVITIHDGFDPSRLRPTRCIRDAEGRFVVQYAGNMGLSHPFTTIVRAARLLRAHTDIHFQFIGDGPGRALLAEHLPANATLNSFAPAEQLGNMLASAHVCLVSQHQEMWDQALPYKVYSILAAGKPMIFVGSQQSEVVTWLSNSGAGLHTPQGDARTLADHILLLQKDAALRAEMGHRAKALFTERFGSGFAARRWLELIQTTLKL